MEGSLPGQRFVDKFEHRLMLEIQQLYAHLLPARRYFSQRIEMRDYRLPALRDKSILQ